jgi:hypothetical protein
MSTHKDYLGDGVYVDFDGFSLVLTTENGVETTNTMILEPQVYEALTRYVARLVAELAEIREHRTPEAEPDANPSDGNPADYGDRG